MTRDEVAAEMRRNPDYAQAIAIGHIRAVVRPTPRSDTAGMSDAQRIAEIDDVLAALGVVEAEQDRVERRGGAR